VNVPLPAAVAPGVALSLAERPESSHGHTVRRAPDILQRVRIARGGPS
jgi:hypothetical protein